MAEQTELLDLASKFFNNIVKGFHNKVGDKDRGNKTISSSLITEEVNKAKKRFKDKEDVVYTGPDFTTITKFTKKLLDAYNKSVLERTKRENVSSRKKNTAQTRKPNSPKIHTVSVKVNSNSNTRNKNIKVPEYKKPKTYFIDKNNNKKAAVTAEELKKSGLSLRDYLNKKRGLKRKTKK
mgnify:CR=1 FL=1